MRFGCRLEWCKYIPKIHMAQFFVAAYVTLIGYPFVVALTSGIYSRVLGNIPQVNFYLCSYNELVLIILNIIQRGRNPNKQTQL